MSFAESIEPLEERSLPQSIFDPDTLVKKGWCTVAQDPHRAVRSHQIYYELHGEDKPTSKRLVWIMGLNNSSFAWHNQVRHFSRLSNYACLVFDNRGVGNSDSPRGMYKTSEMAKDVEELLQQLGWLSEDGNEGLNIVGVSMGGMIAQELALLLPRHVRTLLLTSTKSGATPFLQDLPSYAATRMFALLSSGMVRSPEDQVKLVAETLFPKSWLEETVQEEGEWKGRKRRDMVEADFLHRYHLGTRQPLSGRLGQMAAVLAHRVTPARLSRLAASLPPTSKIAIIHGDQDALIDVRRGEELHRDLPGSELRIVRGGGHALPSQIKDEYNEWIRENVERD
ncbi:hypothetical protein JCM21900_003481 [Sporobolomyces salmonicolor]